jgi:hypothetical protein
MEDDGSLVDESPEQAELSVLRVLLGVRPGERVTFETSFADLCSHASDEDGQMKELYDRTLAAWMRIGEMIEVPAGPQ